MKLINQEISFALRIAGYQFPHLANEPYDSNWLIIELNVTTSQGSWAVSDPCLLTQEVSELANWLDKIAANDLNDRQCSFLEPVLEFRLTEHNQEESLEVLFHNNVLPPSITKSNSYSIFFPLSDVNLSSAANDLRKQLTKYPQRTEK